MRTGTGQQDITQDRDFAAMLQMAQWHTESGDAGQAEICYRWVLEREPDNIHALHRLAMLLHRSGTRADEALPLLETAMARNAGDVRLHTSRAIVLNDLGRRVEALAAFADACCLAPGNIKSLYNIGLLLAELCCPAQAEVVARHLLAHFPDWPAAHYLLVRALTALGGDSAELHQRYDYLVKSDPLNVSLRFARGLAQLRSGNYAAGWEAQEWRWEIEPVKSSRLPLSQPRWAGGELEGRRLLVTGEQGFGDILQFARYLPLLIERGAHVTLQLDDNRAPLARLLSRIKGLEIVVGREDLPACDLHCPLASLPYVFDTTLDTIPPPPVLDLGRGTVAAWRERLWEMPRPWVGLCWAGSPEHNHDIRRSLPLSADSPWHHDRLERDRHITTAVARVAEAVGLDALKAATAADAAASARTLAPLLRRARGSFISLQLGPCAADIDTLPFDLRSRFLAPLTAEEDFYDTACLIQALDHVITVDTSVAHLAGTLGKPTVLIKPAAPEWRWIERDGKSPWYPSLLMMEQHEIGSGQQ